LLHDFSYKKQHKLDIVVDDLEIQKVITCKCLGVILNSTLKWSERINYLKAFIWCSWTRGTVLYGSTTTFTPNKPTTVATSNVIILPNYLPANTQSINNKIDKLEQANQPEKIAACITETWFNKDVILCCIDNYTTYRQDRSDGR